MPAATLLACHEAPANPREFRAGQNVSLNFNWFMIQTHTLLNSKRTPGLVVDGHTACLSGKPCKPARGNRMHSSVAARKPGTTLKPLRDHAWQGCTMRPAIMRS
jgi:hypothetical protein